MIKYKFFSKNNGFSKGIYSSLNCGIKSKDHSNNIKKNINLALKKIGFPNRKLILPNQNHTDKCLILESEDNHLIKADGIVTKSKNFVIGVTTADCIPIILFDPEKEIIGICHAGWKGLSKGIIENTVSKMLILGSKCKKINAVIGPCIRESSYEVDRDFYKKFALPLENDFTSFLNKSCYFNLPKFAKNKLNSLKINNIKDCRKNTYLDKNYFSYRGSINNNYKDYGRNLSLLAIK